MRKKVCFPMLAVGLVGTFGLWATPAAAPKPLKPVAVVCFAGYNELKADVAFVGKISGRPRLADNLEAALELFTGGKGLAGLDKSRPWGAVIQTDGDEFTGYAFFPVTDLEALVKVVEPYARRVEQLDGGVYKIVGKGFKAETIYVQEQLPGWAIAAKKPELLVVAAADPTGLIEGPAKQYDVSAQILAANMPEKLRQKAIADLKANARKDLKRKRGESDREHALRKQLSDEIVKSVATVLNDVDKVTLGWSLDHKTEKTYVDVNITAKKGSETARAAAALKTAKTGFGGFRLPEAAVSGNWTGKMPEKKIAILSAVVEAVRDQAMTDIEKENKPDAEKQAAKKMAGDVFDVAAATIKAGTVDGGMAVLLSPNSVTAIAGGRIADTEKLDELAKQLTAVVRLENPAAGEWIKLDAGRCKGVRLHTASIPIPDDAEDREKVVGLIGEKLEVVIGFGDDSAYVAVGRDAMSTLKKAIEQSADEASQPVPPVRLSLALRPIAEFVAKVGEAKDRPKAALIAEELAKTSGGDRVHLVAAAIPDGVRYRLEVEKGLVRLLGHLKEMEGQN